MKRSYAEVAPVPWRTLLAASLIFFAAFVLLFLSADSTPTMKRKLFGLWRAGPAVAVVLLFVASGALFAAARSRQAVVGYVSACIGATGVLAALETAGLMGLISWPTLLSPPSRIAPIGWVREPLLDVRGETVQDLASSWGMPSKAIQYHFRTDRYGFRNHVDRAGADVILIGDSMVVGSLVPPEATVAASLEQLLGQPVMQVALLGRAPQEAQQLFRDSRIAARGRHVLQFIFEGNDLLDSRRFRTGGTALVAQSWVDRSLSFTLLLKLQHWTQPSHGALSLRSCDIGGDRYLFGWVRDSFAGYDSEIPHITTSIKNFAAEVEQEGGKFSLVFVPSKLRVLGPQCRFPPHSEIADFQQHLSPLREQLGAWSKLQRIPILDLTGPLQQSAQAGRIPWFAGDTHWNDVGHAVAADAIATWGRPHF